MMSRILFLSFVCSKFQVYITVSSLHAHLSPSIYGAVLELIAHLGIVFSPKNESVTSETLDPLNMTPNGWTTHIFGFSVNANLESVSLQVDIANNGDYSSALMLSLRDLDIWYVIAFGFCVFSYMFVCLHGCTHRITQTHILALFACIDY